MAEQAFAPTTENAAALSVSATTGSVARSSGKGGTVRIVNKGPNGCYVKFGDSAVTATTSNMFIPAGNTEVFTVGTVTHVAAICDTGESAALNIQNGEGV